MANAQVSVQVGYLSNTLKAENKAVGKRFDVSLGGGFWLDFMEDIRVKVGYKFGLTNTSKLAGVTERNNILSISVGYVF